MNNLTDSERLVALAGVIVVFLVAAIRGFLWFWNVTPKPDPWGPEIDLQLEDPQTLPVCHHCLAPHAHTNWFCPECGAAVGDYNNWNPYLYIFSLGEVLRAGTFGKTQRTWLTVLGYLILSVGEYVIFAPAYWILFFMNLAGSPANFSFASAKPPTLPPASD